MAPRDAGLLKRLPSRQRGVVLVASLMILLVLTIIGLAAMRTSSLEERMAGNIQEATYAFEAAESALNKALNEPGGLNLSTPYTSTDYPFGGSAKAKVTNTFKEFSPPKRGSGYSVTSFDAANFDQESNGQAGGGAQSTLHRGIAQIVPKQ